MFASSFSARTLFIIYEDTSRSRCTQWNFMNVQIMSSLVYEWPTKHSSLVINDLKIVATIWLDCIHSANSYFGTSFFTMLSFSLCLYWKSRSFHRISTLFFSTFNVLTLQPNEILTKTKIAAKMFQLRNERQQQKICSFHWRIPLVSWITTLNAQAPTGFLKKFQWIFWFNCFFDFSL